MVESLTPQRNSSAMPGGDERASPDPDDPWPNLLPLLAMAGFVALLLLMFVTLHPFDPPPALATSGNAVQSAGGDALRQVLYSLALLVVLLAAFGTRGLAAFEAVPPLLALLLIWCLASAFWATQPDVVFRRAVLATIVALSTLFSVETIGHERAFRLLRLMLVCVLVVNWISIPLIHAAVHLPGEADPGLIGDWRGLYGQKNVAGVVSALTILLFLFSGIRERKWINILVIAAALGFLVMTRSKTSLGALPIAALAGVIYRLAWRRGLDRAIVSGFALLLLLLAVFFVAFNADWLGRLLENPAEFTGRAEIWQADLAFIRNHLLRGAGFGTVAGTGGPSFLKDYVSSAWVRAVGDSHNGYLQLLVELGVVGCLLAALALLAAPLSGFWPLDADGTSKAGLFAIFVFVVLHNFTESDFLQSDSGAWFVFLLVIASLRQRARTCIAAESGPPPIGANKKIDQIL